MSTFAAAGRAFVREQLRQPLTLVLLVLIPAVFVTASVAVLSEFAAALGGEVSGGSAGALGAGWAAAFLSGVLGFFAAASSHGADRRLALAGLGAARVAVARIASAALLGAVATLAASLTLLARTDIADPVHAVVAIAAFSLIYIAVGTFIGSLVRDPLEGTLAVALVFVVDVFAGPGMSDSGGPAMAAPTRTAAEVLVDAGAGRATDGGDWILLAVIVSAGLALALAAFWWRARPAGARS